MKTPLKMRLTLKEKGITIKELAPVIGYSYNYLSGVLGGREKMPQGFAVRFDEAVARVLNSRRKPKAASAALDLTEWQREYLEGLIQGEIEDKETWLKYADGEDIKYSIKLRLDALRNLKAFLEEGGQA